MKKFILLAALSIVVLGVLVMPAAAQQQADLTALAKYFPANSSLYIGFRTDDAMIDLVDQLAAKIGTVAPSGIPANPLRTTLDAFAADHESGETFAQAVRPWAGSSGALGFTDLSADGMAQNAIFEVSITDPDKAKAFFDPWFTQEGYTLTTNGNASVYTSTEGGEVFVYMFLPDVLIVTDEQSLINSAGAVTSSLADNPDFNPALALLPGSQYDAVAYADTPAILSATIQKQQNSFNPPSAAAMQLFNGALSSIKPQAFGLTMLDDHTLAIDAAAPRNPNANSPFVMNVSSQSIDPSFAQHIPANTPFVVEGTDLYDTYQSAINNLETIAKAAPQDSTNGNSMQNLQTGLWGLGFVVRGLTGLEVSDAFGWATGDYAFSLGFTPAFSDSASMMSAMTAMPVDFGLTLAATDAAAAQKVYDGLKRSMLGIPAKNITVTETTLDSGTKALDFTITGPKMPYPLEILAATGNGVFAIGTKRMVTAAINPQNGLNTDAGYTAGSGYFLKNASIVAFLDGAALAPLVQVMTAANNPMDMQMQGQQFGTLLKLLQSASISVVALPDNGGTLERIVWTLPEVM